MEVSAAQIASLPQEARAELLASLSDAELAALHYEWPLWARPDQLPPPPLKDDLLGSIPWRTWLLLGGRGSGKTRSSVEWVRGEVESGRRVQLGVVGPTSDAVRRVQIEGPSGLLSVCPPWNRPSYEPSTRKVIWPSGAVCHLFSAEEVDRLRGPNLDGAWADELTSWADPAAAWDMLQMCLRVPGPLGDPPQCVVSTTPKMQPLLKAIMKAPSTVVTRAKTSDNAANLDASTLKYLHDKYGGTTLGRQELDAELLEDAQGALWTRANLDETRVHVLPEMKRIVVAIDPAGSSGPNSDETGIVACGVGMDGRGYVIADASGKYTPDGWARAAVNLYHSLKADRIVAEKNYGGEMCEATIRAVAPNVPVHMVHATRGKAIRAEPVAAIYEQRRISHVGQFPALEDQMCGWEPGDSNSPDRVDAMVWAFSELMVEKQSGPAIVRDLLTGYPRNAAALAADIAAGRLRVRTTSYDGTPYV